MRIRRRVGALAVPLLLFTAVACGSDDGSGKVSVEGKFGEKPVISTSKGAKAKDTLTVSVVSQGNGPVVAKGAFVRADYAAATLKDGKTFDGSWAQQSQVSNGVRRQAVQQLGQPAGQLVPPKVIDSLQGQRVGSRVRVEGTVKAMLGDQAGQSQLSPEDGLLWVLDVVGAQQVDPKAEAGGQPEAPQPGMPMVKVESQKPADITIPKGEKPPADLKQQVLIKGSGPEVKAGDGLIAQYTGVKWDDGKKFDSTWDHSPPGATAFQIGVGSVIPGWDKGLVGKHVGDRVELVIPANLAYGDNPPQTSGIPKGATLVFVVDIVGKV
ncbi:FKBP-type peptidyl-prolyl cis-trans isomerase [Streptomyces sp. NPDC052396]|uniref:FKBP-type peptidyl-prolyl cis-trans isomerase n=1 Tax=Streptomyces sp. NPDC052396 TaxID=3365689 RepID=UPI0037D8767B